MAAKVLNKDVPKYYQIGQDIIASIQNGDLKTGQQIPSENEIIERYRVSNTTARKALKAIEDEGWVERIKGRGTYVRTNSVERSINRILGFTKNMLEAGRNPSTKLIDAKIIKKNKSIIIHGRKYLLRAPIYQIQRMRYADGLPMMHETRYISAKLCPGMEKKYLQKSLYDIYRTEYNIQLHKISQVLSATIIDKNSINLFDIDEPIPAFKVEGVSFCSKELIVEMEESIYRGDKYRFLVTATE
jgi:GntR family transcriptional regulator